VVSGNVVFVRFFVGFKTFNAYCFEKHIPPPILPNSEYCHIAIIIRRAVIAHFPEILKLQVFSR